MTSLLVAKQYIKGFISKYEVYLVPLSKLILAMVSLLLINGEIGYMSTIDNFAIVLVAALMCSFMPANFTILISGLFILLHMYTLSMEYAVITFAIFLLMFLLYFRFTPKDTIVVLLMPICFILKIPYVMPIAMGLIGTPASAISVGSGVIVYYLIAYISDESTAVLGMESEDVAAKFRYIIDTIINDRAMFMTVIAFAITLFVVYAVRRLVIAHAWTIAITAGVLTNIMVLLIGDLMFDTNVSILGVIIGSIIAAGIAKVIEFFAFNVDYSRTESVQFEDDEYYYYVKAVPKITVAAPEQTVKKINTAKKKPAGNNYRR